MDQSKLTIAAGTSFDMDRNIRSQGNTTQENQYSISTEIFRLISSESAGFSIKELAPLA
jgi:hypothetical protein